MKQNTRLLLAKRVKATMPEHAQRSIIPVEVVADWAGNTFSKSTSEVNTLLDAGNEQSLK